MTNPTPLSSAALEVLDAYMNNCGWLDGPLDRDYRCVAAVLRAAADQIAPVEYELIDDCWYEEKDPVRDQLLAIAAELEGHG